MIDIPRIRAFLAAAECLNFTEAARRLYVTQPTLSKQIALIEDDLGFKLFVRSNRNVSSPRKGLSFTSVCVPPLMSLTLPFCLPAQPDVARWHLRVGCFETLIGNPTVLQLCSAFLQLCPNADLQVDFSRSALCGKS